MFRQYLPRAGLILVLGAVVVLAASIPARSQDASTEERLDRLERDLNMLQRQVYGGVPPPPMPGAPPPASAANTGAAVDIEVRMERLEQQMRDLTGRVEEVGNRVEQLRQRIEQVNSDVDMRLGGAPAASSGAAAAAVPNPSNPPLPPPPPGQGDLAGLPPPPLPLQPAPGGPTDMVTPPPAVAAPSENGMPPAASSGPTPIFGTLQPPGAPPQGGSPPPLQPQPSSPLAAAGAPPKPPPAPAGGAGLAGGSPDQQYDYAFDLVKKADYSNAETALKAFIERHPNDRLAGSAQYWLGETYYARGRYLEAASAFAEGYKRYPKGPKAADDLLKLGMALARANQTQNACLAFGQLQQDFPHPGAAIKERAVAERRRLHC